MFCAITHAPDQCPSEKSRDHKLALLQECLFTHKAKAEKQKLRNKIVSIRKVKKKGIYGKQLSRVHEMEEVLISGLAKVASLTYNVIMPMTVCTSQGLTPSSSSQDLPFSSASALSQACWGRCCQSEIR